MIDREQKQMTSTDCSFNLESTSNNVLSIRCRVLLRRSRNDFNGRHSAPESSRTECDWFDHEGGSPLLNIVIIYRRAETNEKFIFLMVTLVLTENKQDRYNLVRVLGTRQLIRNVFLVEWTRSVRSQWTSLFDSRGARRPLIAPLRSKLLGVRLNPPVNWVCDPWKHLMNRFLSRKGFSIIRHESLFDPLGINVKGTAALALREETRECIEEQEICNGSVNIVRRKSRTRVQWAFSATHQVE